jgi:leader peptidase (prepilin peptidase)/N-methyltransferase
MRELTLVLAAMASLPAAWLVLVFVDRIPDRRPLWRPWPAIPLPRGLSLADGSVYPITAAVFVLTALRFEEIYPLVCYAALATVLVALSAIDIETLRLPDRLVLPSIVAGLAAISASAAIDGELVQLTAALVGGAIYFAFLLAAHLVSPRGMGFGDVKLAFLMGMFLAWPTGGLFDAFVAVLWAMLIGFGGGSIIGIGILVVRGRSAPYPFGPFLIAGAVTVMLAAPTLLPDGDALLF